MQLPPRLLAIAGFVPPGRRIVDVGTDHALLPIYLVKNGISPSLIAGDLHTGPYEVARAAVEEAGLQDLVSVRLGDGLSIVQPGEAEVAVIAGMGGGTIREIIRNSMDTATQMERMVLQPMVDAGALRTWLAQSGWRLADEALIEESGSLYEVIAVVRGREEETDPLLLEIGPRLVEKRDPLLKKHLKNQAGSLKRIIYSLALSSSPEALHKKTELLAKLGEMKKVLAWL